jgi:Anti-sigma factor NepR
MSSVRRNRSPRTRVAQSEKASAIREAQRVIGQNLRAYYDLAQPVPDRVAELLDPGRARQYEFVVKDAVRSSGFPEFNLDMTESEMRQLVLETLLEPL